MTVSYLGEILITLGVAWIYLTVVRFVDVNEREPVWALATVFGLGLLGAVMAELLVGSEHLTLPVWRGAFAVEATKLIALLLGIAIFSAQARVRGWSEFTDLTDGIVYGIAVGLGYSTGETLVRELASANVSLLHIGRSPIETALNAAAGGLSHGVFAAVAGLGVGAAFEARSRIAEGLWALLGLGGAVALNGLFRVLAHGNALGGEEGHIRAWLAVILPMILLAGIGLVSLLRERSAIRAELAEEVRAGVVLPEEAALLDSFWRRQLAYIGLLASGRVGRCFHLAALHNRQVQLALLKRRLARESDPAHRERAERQLALVRAAIRHARSVVLVALLLLGTFFIGAGKPAAGTSRVEWANIDSLINRGRLHIDTFWKGSLGALYRPPADVGPYPLISMYCPLVKGNAEYCRRDRHIYYDRNFLDSLWHTPGDFAPVYVLAHEWGHLVQDLRGDLNPLSGKWTIEIELEADCLAGQFARNADAKKLLDPGDAEEAVEALRAGGDSPGTPWFQTGAHGTSDQRIDAYNEGVGGRPCSGAGFDKAVRNEASAGQQKVTPMQGTLTDATPCRQGRFVRKSLRFWPEALNEVVNDAIIATFESPDGITIQEYRVALRTMPAAQARFDLFINHQVDASGYKVVGSGRMKDGELETGIWKRLQGLDEMVLIRNRQVVNVYEGPAGATWEFAIGTPVYNCTTP